ncbi:putative CENPB DNA-binding domain-containing protein 1 [Discoglossus pictus]
MGGVYSVGCSQSKRRGQVSAQPTWKVTSSHWMFEHKEDQPKLKRQSMPLDLKLQVLYRLEWEWQSDTGVDLTLQTSTTHNILRNKEKIKSSVNASTASSAKKITHSRCYTLEEMEKRLSICIDKLECNISLSQGIIMKKVRSIYSQIETQTPDVTESCAASRGWIDLFQKRSNIYNINITKEVTRADTVAAAGFPATLKDVVERGNYPVELVFNMDETNLF